ncbi:MAG: adenine phosphoribosyltransferase [Kiritimatiellia bacterium]
MKRIEDHVRTVADFPKPGILFRDVTGVLASHEGLRLAVDSFADALAGVAFDIVVGVESRGFIFGAPVAYKLGKAFVPVRKSGKLPGRTISESYALEYGEATLQIHACDVRPGQRVVVVDDLLATGGTAAAAARLVERLGAKVVKMAFLVELDDLGGRQALSAYEIASFAHFPGH